MKQTIADNLTLYRKGLGLSRKALTEKAGVAIATIENYENARNLPDSKTLSVLARALDVTIDDLLRVPPAQLPDFRFRALASFKQNPQLAARVRRMLETYNAIEVAVGASPFAPETLSCDRLEPENQRYRQLIWRALELENISEMKAAELLGLTVEQLRMSRQELL